MPDQYFFHCNSDFDLDLQARPEYGIDDDGDPVIENIKDNEEVQENFQFGSGKEDFVMAMANPDATVSDIVIRFSIPTEYDISEVSYQR